MELPDVELPERRTRKVDYGDFSQYQVRCLIADYCREITLGTTGWGVPFTAWVELRGIAKFDGRFRLIRIKHPTPAEMGLIKVEQPYEIQQDGTVWYIRTFITGGGAMIQWADFVEQAAPEQPKFSFEFVTEGKKAQCPSNPEYPNGMVIQDPTLKPGDSKCQVFLPEYPAPSIGVWKVLCNRCGRNVACSAAGRPDDPRVMVLRCKPHPLPEHGP